jgi:hypothetical protein
MRLLICSVLAMSWATPANAQLEQLPVFGDDWYVAPSPDPERVRVENGLSLRFRGLVEVPYPADCSVFSKSPYVIDENASLRLGFQRGKVETDSCDFRYGLAALSGETRIVLFHHLTPGWNGTRGWTLHRTTRDAGGKPEMQEQSVFHLRDELIASYPSKFSMPTFFDNPESLQVELSSKGLKVTRNGESRMIDVIDGDMIGNVPGMLDRYDRIVVPYGDVVDERERAALAAHADKLVIESPKIFAQAILWGVFPRSTANGSK